MKRMTLILVLAVVMIIGFGIVYAAPDNDTQNSIVTLNLPHAVRLDISNADSSKTLNQDGDAEIDFETGYTDLLASYPTLTVRANKSWKLSAKSTGFGAVEGYNKDVGDLMLVNTGAHKSNGFDVFKSLSLVDQEVASYGVGIKADANAMQYRVKLDWTKDIPGTYTATVTYTLATQG